MDWLESIWHVLANVPTSRQRMLQVTGISLVLNTLFLCAQSGEWFFGTLFVFTLPAGLIWYAKFQRDTEAADEGKHAAISPVVPAVPPMTSPGSTHLYVPTEPPKD